MTPDPPPADDVACAIERALLDLLAARDASASVCPSEVARQLWPAAWREHLSDVRAVARVLAVQGRVTVTQRGRVLDPQAPWRGALRLALGGRDNRVA
ncbi:DUF3253 domain-containing protein [Azohydromonas sediminis]|uniref:DUF3253 domain-containing protein n=1 Tax=Azohydromonas sediminis TaxID=2259674 RepID=UPI000E65DADC|nr:DUF3253 domain-containing protein [Azohydromonas sediminis]